MKKMFAIASVLTLILTAVSIATDSPKGGKVGKGEGFNISVPTFDTKVKQGEIRSVTISLERGEAFKQDVMLEVKSSKDEGMTFGPSKFLVKANDKPDVKFTITALKNAAIGEYTISVTATPTTGEATSVSFNINVVAPDAGYTMHSESSKGGSTIKGEGFNISVPTFATKTKQGEIRNVTISLERGESFKQDVMLEITLSKGEGITFDPAKVLIKAGDKSDVQLQILAAKDVAIGEYVVSVKGTPTSGEATSAKFKVTVVAP